jgi:hypothetical protein
MLSGYPFGMAKEPPTQYRDRQQQGNVQKGTPTPTPKPAPTPTPTPKKK